MGKQVKQALYLTKIYILLKSVGCRAERGRGPVRKVF